MISIERNAEGTWDIVLTLPPDYTYFTPMGGSGFATEDEAYNALERLEVRPKSSNQKETTDGGN